MKDFKKSGGFGGSRGGDRGGDRGPRRDFGGRPSFGGKSGGFGGNRGGGDRGPRRDFGDRPQMHQATCSECAKMCEVPFRPTGEKPVYCSECFGGKKEGGFRDNRSDDRGSRREFSPRPSFNKPEGGNDNKRIDELKKDIEFLNVKLDRILRAIENTKSSQPVEKKEMAKPVVVAELKKAIKKAAPAKKEAPKKAAKKAAKKGKK